MRLLIAGDLVINRPYNAAEKIHPELIKIFAQSDCNIVNLEAPVTDCETKIIKTGPYLKAHRESTLDVLSSLNIHLVTLANNHIKDYDEQGVLDTIDFCRSNGIDIMGAGTNLESAAQTKVLKTPEGSIAIINIAENEWASAEENSAGANGMCLIKDTRKIQQAKQLHDFVFVIVHGGHEYHNLPSPRMQQQYRFYAEQGADLVVAHHTHCVSGYEVYNNTPIYYSLGNFLFTKNNPSEDWYFGLVLQLDIREGKLAACLLPIEQVKESFELRQPQQRKWLLSRVDKYSQIIQDEAELYKSWQQLVKQKQRNYLMYWSARMFINNRYLSAALNRMGLKLTSKKALAYFLNLMRCEAHSDISRAVIKENLKP